MPSSACKTCALDRKSTRLNSSHTIISYAVFCLKKNKNMAKPHPSSPVPTPLPPHSSSRGARVGRRGGADGVLGRGARHDQDAGLGFFFKDPAPPEISPLPLHAPFRI